MEEGDDNEEGVFLFVDHFRIEMLILIQLYHAYLILCF